MRKIILVSHVIAPHLYMTGKTQHYLRVNCAAGRAGVPVLVEHPADLVVARDEPATLRCEAAGEPQPSIVWLKDGQEVRTAPVDPTRYSS